MGKKKIFSERRKKITIKKVQERGKMEERKTKSIRKIKRERD